MTTKHTPGPWFRNIKPARKYPTVWAGRNTHVAVVVAGAPHGSGSGADMSDEEIEANIDLIAAAPEMLAALEGFNLEEESIVGAQGGFMILRIPLDAITAAVAARAKATGRP